MSIPLDTVPVVYKTDRQTDRIIGKTISALRFIACRLLVVVVVVVVIVVVVQLNFYFVLLAVKCSWSFFFTEQHFNNIRLIILSIAPHTRKFITADAHPTLQKFHHRRQLITALSSTYLVFHDSDVVVVLLSSVDWSSRTLVFRRQRIAAFVRGIDQDINAHQWTSTTPRRYASSIIMVTMNITVAINTREQWHTIRQFYAVWWHLNG